MPLGTMDFWGVEHVTVAKAALVRDLYSEVAWHAPQRVRIGGIHTHAPFGNKRAAAIVQYARKDVHVMSTKTRDR